MSPPRWAVIAAFAAIYLVWGSTYLAIRVAVDTLPPFLMLGVRFLFAGLAMAVWARARGAAWPTLRQWGWAALLGFLMPCWGTGSVAWSEQFLPSGLTALLAATVPIWVVVIDALWGRRGFDARVVVGVLAGFAGVALLLRPSLAVGGSLALPAVGVLMTGAVAWAVGSVLTRGADQAPSPILGSGLQMAIGGLVLTLAGLAAGEGARADFASFSLGSVLAFGYLIVFGSFVAFSCYLWLLRVVEPTRVATYAYVNPVIALVIGWGLGGETLTPSLLLAAAVVLGSVVLVLRRPPPSP